MYLRLVIAIGLLSLPVLGQVPPGPAYDPELHPNAIVTFVETSDFAAASYEEARESADIELIELSGLEGTRVGIQMAPSRALEVRVLGRRTEVLTFPVVQQTFRLKDGETLDLYSFRMPRTNLLARDEEDMLNAHALSAPGEPGEGRFGPIALPDMLSVRGRPALLFTEDLVRTLFWQENGTSHVAVSRIDEDDLFWVVEDLL